MYVMIFFLLYIFILQIKVKRGMKRDRVDHCYL